MESSALLRRSECFLTTSTVLKVSLEGVSPFRQGLVLSSACFNDVVLTRIISNVQ